MAVTALEEEEFRAVKAIAGDSISIVVGEEGDVRAWGSFRVSLVSWSNQILLQLTDGPLCCPLALSRRKVSSDLTARLTRPRLSLSRFRCRRSRSTGLLPSLAAPTTFSP